MAGYPENYPELSDNFSLEGEEADLSPAQKLTPATQKADNSPVTTAVLKSLLADLQRTFQTHVATLRADIHSLTGRMGALESASSACSDQITILQQEVQELQRQNVAQERCFAALENACRANNLKIRGIPENIPAAEMPHVLRCLLVALLNPKHARNVQQDGFFRALKLANAPGARRPGTSY
ncbi:Hypothetical predicted protein [Pelobates cultripes]|uniref:Uncharacterized protein n=1 Tax=Pelobates cultripes TaxID=61616 RepID=A0AAD1SGT6_PELCU|nr:Hypothetical predicted protein [Pelobates cultripes]